MHNKSIFRKIARTVSLILLSLLLISGFMMSSKVSASTTWWQPTPSAPIHWQWQIGTPFNVATDQIPNVNVYDIDAYDNAAIVVAALHAKGYIVIAYVSFGTYENWRPDAASFPASVRGSGNGWPGENWLDIRSDAVKTIMAARLDLIKSKGFDAVEPDNIDGYSNSTGFPLTAQDQLNYNQWIAAQCHQRGLSVGLKNDVEQASALAPYFDWALNEESYKYGEYSTLTAFTNSNKAVFEVEYGKNTSQASTMNSLRFNSLTRDLDLLSPGSSGYVRLPCIPDTQNTWSGTGGGATIISTPAVGTITISTSPTGASLSIDGSTVGLAPQVLTLGTGSHTIQATLSGYQTFNGSVSIVANNNNPITVALKPVASTPITTTTTIPTTTTRSNSNQSSKSVVTTTPAPSAPSQTQSTSPTNASSNIPASSTGGGGGGAFVPSPKTVAGVTNIPSAVDSKGVLNQDVNAWSDDNNILLHIPAGSAVLAARGIALTQINMIDMITPPAFQAGAGKISLVYDLTPAGTTFSPAATMRVSYDPTLIPAGVAESSLQIAYYDSATSSWITLASTVDTGSHFIYAQITHFTPYAVTYGVKPVPPVPTTTLPVLTTPQPVLPTPAAFSTSKLVVSPLEVNVGDSVKISALVTNTGGLTGNYAVDLKINGQKVASQSLTLAGGASQTVTFTTTGNTVGNYTVAVSNLSGTFTVKKAPVPATFTTGSLMISPGEINTGETATVQVTVTNNGDLAGATIAVLKLNNNIIATKDLALTSGESQNATFTTSQNTAGTYTVDINGQLGSLRVKAYSFFKWLLIPGILAFAIGLISTILVVVMRTKGKWGGISSNLESK